MFIDTENLLEIKKKIPEDDFVDVQYDYKANVKTTNILIILSTQRSGSTFLCELIKQSNFCLPHEYFQPFEYLKILSERWGCLIDNELNIPRFIEQLKKNRTYDNGWLGINLHGSHLEIFKKMEKELAEINVTYIHLVRNNQVAQAVSYYVASEGGQWSSNFKKKNNPNYSYQLILEKLLWIQEQNRMIKRYLSKKKYQTISYEDFVLNPHEYISKITGSSSEKPLKVNTNLKKQKNKINETFIFKFKIDYKKSYVKNIIKKLFRDVFYKFNY